MATPAWIGLGSNLGDRRAILDEAVAALAREPGVTFRTVSSYHETAPVGGPDGQGPFLNAAVQIETTLDVGDLLWTLQQLENQAGRVRTIRWGERTLDLDILIYGTVYYDAPALKLPHPRLAFRRFVLAPLAEIAPEVVDVRTKRTIADLLAGLDRKPRLLAIAGSPGPLKEEVYRRLVEELPAFGIAEADLEVPEGDFGLDPAVALMEALERKARALRAPEWAEIKLRVPWIVADYFLGRDIILASARSLWPEPPGSKAESKARFDAHQEWKRRANALPDLALPPTFVLSLPGEAELPRRPGQSSAPLLWPESDEPDAIVAEVLATCRGIDGL